MVLVEALPLCGWGRLFLFVVCNAETALHYLESDAKVEIGPNLASLDTKMQCSTAQALHPYCKQDLHTPTNIDTHSSSIDTQAVLVLWHWDVETMLTMASLVPKPNFFAFAKQQTDTNGLQACGWDLTHAHCEKSGQNQLFVCRLWAVWVHCIFSVFSPNYPALSGIMPTHYLAVLG